MLEHAIGLRGMAARFMDQQREELRREDERGGPLGRERRVEHRLRVVAVTRGACDEIEMLDELPPRLAHQAAVVALRRLRPGLHRGDREARAGLDDLLLHVGALARDEMLVGAVRGDAATAGHGVRSLELRVGGAEQRDAFGERDRERIARERGAVLAPLRCDRRQRDRRGARACGGFRACERFVDDGPQRHVVGAVGGGEAPGAPMEDAKTDAAVARPRDRLDLAVANGDRLVLALDATRVSVCRAPSRAEIDKVHQVGVALGHARRLVSGTSRCSRGQVH